MDQKVTISLFPLSKSKYFKDFLCLKNQLKNSSWKEFERFYVMVDQCEALAVTTGLTDTVYLVRPTGIRTVNPWVSKH